MSWTEKEIPCEPHHCHWCDALITCHLVTIYDGVTVTWPYCPECKGT